MHTRRIQILMTLKVNKHTLETVYIDPMRRGFPIIYTNLLSEDSKTRFFQSC